MPGQITVSGRITDAETGEPLKNVIVYAEREKIRALTDDDGYYRLDSLESEDASLTVTLYGYRETPVVHGEPLTEPGPGVRDYRMHSYDPATPSGDSSYLAGYEMGQKMADAEFQNNDPCWYFGGLHSGKYKNLDQHTGIPMRAVHGCLVDNRIEGLVGGHNDRVIEHIAENGVPAIPRLWKYQFWQDLTDFCTRSGGPDSAKSLWPNGPPVSNGDSTVVLRLVWPNMGDLRTYLEIEKADTVFYTEVPRLEWDTAHVYWGNAEDAQDEVAVLRTGRMDFDLIDLRVGGYRQFYRNSFGVARPKTQPAEDRQ